MVAIMWFVGFVLVAAKALAQLHAGDVAVIAYNTDTPDAFAWMAFRDVPPNTTIHFTSSSVSNNWFRWGDHLGRAVAPGPLSWNSPELLPAGTVVSWVSGTQKCWSIGILSGGVPALSTDGDQLIAYTGTIVSNAAGQAPWIGDCSQAVLLFALNFANAGWDNVTGGGPNTSYVPPGLFTNLGTAVHVNNQDNGYYSGISTGTVGELRSAMAQPVNWTTSPNVISPSSWLSGFHVKGVRGTFFSVR